MKYYPLFLWVIPLTAMLIACSDGQESTGLEDRMRTPSGFEYINHIQNNGPKPQVDEYAFFHVTVLLGDSVLQTSRGDLGRPASIKISDAYAQYGSFKPVVEMIRMMSVNDSATLWYPVDSFPQVPPGFEDGEDIIYQVVLAEIKNQEEFAAFQEAERARQAEEAAKFKEKEAEIAVFVSDVYADYKSGNLENIEETETGLKYVIHEMGDGAVPGRGQPVKAHYYGILAKDGTMFDNSFSRGRPFQFVLGAGSVIKGWDEGFALLPAGTKATFFIPPELGYGKAGSPPRIPEDAELIFYVESIKA